jgi:hypothetical protein
MGSSLTRCLDAIRAHNNLDPVDSLDRFISRWSSARFQHLRVVQRHKNTGRVTESDNVRK